MADKEWFTNILQDSLRKFVSGIESEISQLRSNKNKAVIKKNKERLGQLETRLDQIKILKDKTEEFSLSLDCVD